MAQKVPTQSRKQAPPAEGADDLAILYPDVTLPIGGREVTVREYRFIDGLRIRSLAKPFTAGLQAQIVAGEALTEDVLDLLAQHRDLVRELVLASVDGGDGDWYDGLDGADGELLLLTWWGVCGPFFVRQIARRLAQGVMAKAMLADGATSSPPSPAPATGTSTNSAAPAPSVN